MANIIAVIWDFDKTLISEYMQTPLFEEYGIDADMFWREVNEFPEKMHKNRIRVNSDTCYLNFLIKYAKDGRFKGLNNKKLFEYGKKLKFYAGIPEIFEKTKAIVDEAKYREYNIKVEHYIVSTGTAETIRGSKIKKYVDDIWGCELLEDKDENGNTVISEVIYALDNTSKTRALFEINKGVGKRDGVSVNSKVSEEFRRVKFENMIYIADGPSDIPAFSLVNKGNGSTFAIYPKGDIKAFEQVEKMRKDGRINMYAEADYSENTTAYMWICNKVKEYAERIYNLEKTKLDINTSAAPSHIT